MRAPATRARPPVALLDYGVGNLHSAAKALDRAGADVRLVDHVERAGDAAALVVPGVGAYGACLEALGRSGGAEGVHAWIATGRPLLGVCVGMQLLYQGSQEGEVDDGIGVLAGTVARLGPGVKVPHIGWNEVHARHPSRLLAGLEPGTRFYFVHSYAGSSEGQHVAATCEHGRPFAAVIEDGRVFATQFHPEKSGAAGLTLLANFVGVCA